jgi:hypothetical protein
VKGAIVFSQVEFPPFKEDAQHEAERKKAIEVRRF